MPAPEEAIKTILKYIGADPNAPELQKTPTRVLKMYQEMFAGYEKNPPEILKILPSDGYKDMILVKDIEYFSTCQHHLQPFFGKAHVAYIPGKSITGLSKIPRLIEAFAHRLQSQEQLTQQVADTMMKVLKPKGVAVLLTGKHLCMCNRGVKQSQSETVTQSWLGDFKKLADLRQEFLQQI